MMFVLSACTPIAAVGHDANDKTGQQPNDSSTERAVGAAGAMAEPGSASTIVGTAQIASPCSEPGKRLCATRDERTPLLCKDASWQPQDSCSELERCETSAGPQLGSCVPVATECLSHKPGEDFCDGQFLQSCDHLVFTGARSCPDRRRCKEVDKMVRCVCAERWVETASGECEASTTCTENNGGCDSTTSCDASSGQPVCGQCQLGYEGSGEMGCLAQLTLLTLEDALLVPTFSPDVHSYSVALPLLHQSLRVTAQSVPGVMMYFDSVEQAPGSVWQSPPMQLGEHKIVIDLSGENGLKSTYELTVTRSGVQDAYVKANVVGAGDELGGAVAIQGDVMVVGAQREDSASTDPNDNSLEDSGAVYVFVRNGNQWLQQQVLKANPPRANDYFGSPLVLRDDLLFVGAVGANGLSTTTPHGGSVQVFKWQGDKFAFLTKLSPAGAGLQDLFGLTFAVDDKRLIVGAPMDQKTEPFSGAVYAYTRDGESFSEPEYIKATKPVSSGLFGWAVALDGDTIVVGAPQYNYVLGGQETGSGTAYVLGANGNQWTQIQELPPAASLESGATMGWSVAIAGDTIAVGAPRGRAANEGQSPGDAFIYERASGGGWSLTKALQATVPRVSDWFAWQVVLMSPTALLIGAAGDNSGSSGLMGDPKNEAAKESGALYMYARDRGDWVNTTFIKSSNPGMSDNFGSPVSASADTLVCGATGESSDSPGIDGNQASDAFSRAGAVYLFH